MAVLAFAAAGSALGAAVIPGTILGLSGAAIGWTVGSLVGNALTARNQTVRGPQLADLSVQASSYGNLIPEIYGAFRLNGNVIASSNLIPTVTRQSQRAKGGGRVTTESTTYRVTCAIRLCKGPIVGVRKLWANGKLIYSVANDANAETLVATQGALDGGGRLRFYLGDESQMPDSALEALWGAGNVPAYRGVAYMVLEDFELAEYGNRVPQISAEVVTGGTATLQTAEWAPGFTANNSNIGDDITCVQPGSTELYATLRMTPVIGGTRYQTWLLTPNAATFISTIDNVSQSNSYGFINGNSDRPLVCWMRTAPSSSPSGILDFIPLDGTSPPPSIGVGSRAVYGQSSSSFFRRGNDVIVTGDINQLERWIGLYGSVFGEREFQPTSVEPTGIDRIQSVWFTGGKAYAIGYDATENENVIFRMAMDAGLTIEARIPWTNISPLVGTNYIPVSVSGAVTYIRGNPGSQIFAFDGENEPTLVVSVAGGDPNNLPFGEFGANFALDQNIVTSARVSSSNVLIPLTTNLRALPVDGQPLSEIIEDRARLAGLESSQVNVSALTGIDVRGYAVTRVLSNRESIAPLERVFSLYSRESDGVLDFVPREDSTIAAEIAWEDLGASRSEASRDPIQNERADPADLPKRVGIGYVNPLDDYQQGFADARREQVPSIVELIDEAPIVLTPAEAQSVALRRLYEAYQSANTRSFDVSRRYAYLDAGDLVRLEVRPGLQRDVRLISVEDDGQVMRCLAVDHDASVYQIQGEGATSGSAQTVIQAQQSTRIAVMDAPMVRNQDSNSGIYVAMGAPPGLWRGAVVAASLDDVAYGDVGSVTQSAAIGFVDSMPDWDGIYHVNETQRLIVTLTTRGELLSVTRDQMLDEDANAAAILRPSGEVEIIQFRTATSLGGAQYRLTGLLRALRGTERFATGYAGGSARLIMLDAATMARPDFGLEQLDVARYYKGVTFGGNINAQGGGTLAINTGNALRPFSPVQLRGVRDGSGNLTITWRRRTRTIGPALRDAVDVPLGEASQAYQAVIYSDSTYSTELRVIEVTAQTAAYSAANQTTDFGAPQAIVYCRVYQMSADFGRGAPVQGAL